MKLPLGVLLSPLINHPDDRGVFTEIYRESWSENFRTIQWNLVRSDAQVLRGVHVHKKHYDYLTVVVGRVLFGLHDLRTDSPTFQDSAFVEMNENKL